MFNRQRSLGLILSYISIVMGILIALLFTPFFVNTIGITEYGIYSVVVAFIAYLKMFDMGFVDSTIRYLVGFRSDQDEKGMQNFLAIVFILYVFLTSLVLLFGWLIYENFELFFAESFSLDEIELLRQLFLVFLAHGAVTVLFNPLNAILMSRERFVFLRCGEIFVQILTTTSIVLALLYGYKALAAVVITLAINCLFVLCKLIYVFAVLRIRVRLYKLSGKYLFAFLKYSAPIFVVMLAAQTYWKLDQIILGSMVGPEVVAAFAIGIMFNKYFMSFSTAISRVMLPELIRRTHEGATGQELTDILIKISRIQAAVVMLLITGLAVFGMQFITIWIGEEYSDAYYVMMFTLVPYSLELIGNVRNSIMQVKSLYWYRASFLALFSGLNVILTIYLVEKVGMQGAAIATGIGLTFGYIADNMICSRKADIDIWRYQRELWSGFGLAFIFCLSSGALLVSKVQIGTWVEFVSMVLLYTALYCCTIFFIGINQKEKEVLKRLVGKFKRRFA